MKNAVFWDAVPCGFFKTLRSSETSVLTRATRHNIREGGFLCRIMVHYRIISAPNHRNILIFPIFLKFYAHHIR
jgi:hypothetical protein